MPTRTSARDRRADAVRAGVGAFADRGLSSAAVRQAAAEVGVSSAYLFRLFGSQRAYFLACLDRAEELTVAAFAQVRVLPGQDPLIPLGTALRGLVADGSITGLWLQACAVAREDPEIAERCRTLLAHGLRAAVSATGADRSRLTDFLGRGALVMTLQALGVDLGDTTEVAVARMLGQVG